MTEVERLKQMTLQELALEVLGDQAPEWWNKRAIGLSAVPSELAATTEGAELVRDLLIRLHFGVYS